MAEYVLTNAKLWLSGIDFTGVMNALALKDMVELQDSTVIGNAGRRRKAGLRAVTANHEGFWDAAFDKELFDRVGLADQPMTAAPQSAAVGDVAYFFRCTAADYSPGGQVGEMFRFSLAAEGGDGNPLVRGRLLANGAVTADSNGTAVQLGAVAAGQKLYAAMHVLAVSGTAPTLDVVIQRDNASNFPSPVTALTLAQATAVGAQWATPIDGPITDDWFRAVFDIGGTGSPSFTVVIVLGYR